MTTTTTGQKPPAPGNVAVVGVGSIGRGVVQSFATAGYCVWAVTRRPGQDRMTGHLAHEVARGRLTEEESGEISARITTVTLDELPAMDLVVEAIAEDETLKRELFRTLGETQPAGTVLATSTSTIPITRIAGATRMPERVVGMHYMTPVPVMELVEIIVGDLTSEETRQQAEAFCLHTGKTPVVARDHPGFVASRLAQALINEAAWILHHDVADADSIDLIAKLGLNLPVGPLKLLDLVGADVAKRGLDSLRERLGDTRYEASPVIENLVEQGTYGRKTGSGIYTYDAPRMVGAGNAA